LHPAIIIEPQFVFRRILKRKIFTDEEYRDFKESLRKTISAKHLTIIEAAKTLGVTRQSLHLYLMKSTKHQPRWRVLQRACRAWDLTFIAKGQKFDKHAFGKDVGSTPVDTAAVQLLLLPEAIEQLRDANLEVKIVGREPSRIYLELQVKFAS
jgi:hypothetical protein